MALKRLCSKHQRSEMRVISMAAENQRGIARPKIINGGINISVANNGISKYHHQRRHAAMCINMAAYNQQRQSRGAYRVVPSIEIMA